MVANIVTSCRILFSFIMLFFPTFSPIFYGLYLAAGFTDMMDGAIARKLGSESEFGAKLDTVADIAFVAAAAFKILPVLYIPRWIWIWIAVIAAIKVINIVSGFSFHNRFVSIHSIANKVTGGMLFILPLTLPVVEVKYSAVVVCALATFAAIQEGHLVRSYR